ncbi:unnamed protein product [Bursaphelenchus xylophilus]|uniref:Acyl-coenzyme A oxidase n=1 Tax=Bursaphelenchus xylophilus TaxID=6326 RepID=A0A1I7RMH1_BURXY|nr:unnamed protein product [Bursaphelenchus xylophilus]CAG9118484.1 unnamed protein product [Bursaphelenchus xylophilus]
MPNRYIKESDDPDLTTERQDCPFDTDAFAAVIYSGKEKVDQRKKIAAFVENTPELRNLSNDVSYGSKMDWMEQAYRNHTVARRFQSQIVPEGDRVAYEFYKRLTVGYNKGPGVLSDRIVIPMLDACCNEEQRKLFYEPASRFEHYSAYAQTELGHGTNTKALGTSATFDQATQTFVINTPDLQSYKWWPGNLAKVASWCIVMANLIVKGRNYGMHPFYIQIRDESTHQPLPGITVGEIGSNFGLAANDNGYLALDNVRVPKIALLAKHFDVTADGTYVHGVHPRVAYVGMMSVRAWMIKDALGETLAMAACIATRYSCVRRQGEIETGKGEVKIIEYRTQQYRLFPQICRAICIIFAGHRASELYFQMCEELEKGNASLMDDVHAITSGLKAVCSFQAAQGIEQCRLACGGHGYSQGSGLPSIYANTVAACTYEGDNLVMLLQLARYLTKRAKEVFLGKRPRQLASMAEHLSVIARDHSKYSVNETRAQRWTEIKLAFEHLSRRLTMKAFDLLNKEVQQGHSSEVAWNNRSVELCKAAKAFTRVFLAETFVNRVSQIADQSVKEVFEDCLDLYLHYELLECRADLLEDHFVTEQLLVDAQVAFLESLQRLRPNAVNVVDSFDFSDRQLGSQIGTRDGHAYENLYEWARRSPLNKYDVLPFHHETIGKLMKEARAGSKL